jgi:hypothetical protein
MRAVGYRWLVLLLLSASARAATFELGTIKLELPGQWELTEDQNGLLGTSVEHRQRVWFRVAGVPPNTDPKASARAWADIEASADQLLDLPARSGNVDLISAGIPTRLANGAVYREVVYRPKGSTSNVPLATFMIKRGRVVVIAMPGHPDDATPEHLNRIRTMLKEAKWQ